MRHGSLCHPTLVGLCVGVLGTGGTITLLRLAAGATTVAVLTLAAVVMASLPSTIDAVIAAAVAAGWTCWLEHQQEQQ